MVVSSKRVRSSFITRFSMALVIVLLVVVGLSAAAAGGSNGGGERGGTRIDYFEALAYGDMNRDGKPDFVTSSAAVGVIRYWMDDGSGMAGIPLNFTMGSITKGLATADIDEDSYPDIVLGANNQEIVVAYNDGTGAFLKTGVDSAAASVKGLFVEDMDFDGDLDIVTGDTSGNLRITENLGGGTFSGSNSATVGGTISRLRGADMDLDGDIDAVVGTSSGGVYVSNGDGAGSLGSPVSIGSASGGVVNIRLADVDRDGDIDVITGDSSGELALFKNARGSYGKSVLASYTSAIGDVEICDLDNDGDEDIFASSDKTLFYIENSRSSFKSYNYNSQDKTISVIGCGDWDVDGDADIFIGTTSLTIGMIYRTTSIQEVGDYIPNPLALTAGNALSVDCVDVNQDGLGDALVGDSTGAFYKYINNGDGTYSRTLIASRPNGVLSIRGADIDHDGDIDIAVGEDSTTVAVYTNSGSSFSESYTTTLAGKPLDIRLADYNADGEMDVMISNDQGDLDALKKTGSGFTKVTLGSAAGAVAFNCLAVGDVDMDGDIDAAVGDAANNLRFFNNSGTDSFTGSLLGNLLSPVSSIDLGDMDSDGDLDIVTGCNSNKIHVTEYKRNGFTVPSSVANATSAVRGLSLADLNHDTRMDIVTGNSNGEITLHSNRGATYDNVIMSVISHPMNDISAFDLNTDGGIDVMSVNTSGGVTEHGLSYVPLPFVEKVELTNGHGTASDICYAGYADAYRFKVNVTNPDGYLGVDYVLLTLDPGGLDLTYKWINDAGAVNPFSVQSDPSSYTQLMSDRPDEMFDSNKNWCLNFELKFSWDFPKNETLDVKATVYNKQGLFGSLDVGDVFWVESALVCVGSPEGHYQGQPLGQGDWVAGGGNITWKGLKVAYKTNNNHAPSENYTLVIQGTQTPKKEFTVRYGLPIDVNTDIADVTSQNETFTFSFKDMPATFEDKTFEFSVKVDNNPPPDPNNVQIHRSYAEVEKITFDNDGKVYVTWDSVTDAESGTLGYKYSLDSGGDGIFVANNSVNISTDGIGKLDIYVWAVDTVGNEGGSGYSSIFIDREVPSLLAYFPNSTVDTTDLSAECGITIKDVGGSGLDYTTIRYKYSATGLTGFSDWISVPYNSTNYPETLTVAVNVTFGDLDRNYIQWSVADLAGNVYVSESWNVELNIVEKPFEPVVLSLADRGRNHLLLEWTESELAALDFMKYDIYMGHSEGFTPGISNLKITINDKTVTQYNVTGLNPDTNYYFIVRSTNKDNINADSNELNVTTRGTTGGGDDDIKPDKDADLDGMDDNWEYDHFGSLDQGPEDDYDGDGRTNKEEFTNGWDPTDVNDPPKIEDDDTDDDDDETLMEKYGLFIVVFIIIFVIVVLLILVMAWSKSRKKDTDERPQHYPQERPAPARRDAYDEEPYDDGGYYEDTTPIYTAPSHSSPAPARSTKAVSQPRTAPLPPSRPVDRGLPASKPRTLPPASSDDLIYEYVDEEAVYEDAYAAHPDLDDEIDSLDMDEGLPEEDDVPELDALEDADDGLEWEDGGDEDDMDMLSWDDDE